MSQHGCPERLSSRSKSYVEDGTGQATMEVLVETLTGTAFEMTVSPSDTVFAIKSKIFRVEGIPVSQQHLLYNLKELEDASMLHEHAIGDGAKLRLVLSMRGGPISTRRLPPPPAADAHWRDIERLLETNRDDSEEWSAGSGGGCKVTVLVFRDGDKVNMLRVLENDDGTYSPLTHSNKYSSSLKSLVEDSGDDGLSGSVQENAVTMGKMLELRRRMEALSLTRTRSHIGEKPEIIQKTRSEETLSVPSLLEEATSESYKSRAYAQYGEAEDTFAPLYDGNYTRYDYDCSFADRYTLLPPIGSDTHREQPVSESERVELSDALAGSILVKSSREREAAEYGPVVGGGSGWAPPGAPLAAAHSASALHLAPPRPRSQLFSSSTSDLEKLRRNRILPALSRHRNREHLHLSDEGLDVSHRPGTLESHRPRNLEVGSERRQRRINKIAHLESSVEGHKETEPVTPEPAPAPEEVKKLSRVRCGLCRKRLSIATVHSCRCGAVFCAPHRYAEVHRCSYDYKATAHAYLRNANPIVSAPKLPKI